MAQNKKPKSLDDYVKSDKRVISMSQEVLDIERIPSGIYMLDDALEGGFPVGKMAELFGPTGGGKSSIALSTAVAAQERGRVVWIDLEDAFNPRLAEKVGLDLSELIFVNAVSAEEIFEIMENICQTGEASMIVVDSVAGLVTNAEIQGEYGDSHMAILARLMSSGLPKLARNLGETSMLWINQIRDNMNIGYGAKTTTKGGKALPFWCSTRVEVKRIGQVLNSQKELVGQTVQVHLPKARYGKPFQTREFDIIYDRGFDNAGSIIDACVSAGTIGLNGSWYVDTQTGESLGQGKANLAEKLLADQEMYDHYLASITTVTAD